MKKNAKSGWIFVLFLIAYPLGAQMGSGWQLIRHPSPSEFEKLRNEITQELAREKAPMGFTIMGANLYALYLTEGLFKADRWELYWFENSQILEQAVTQKMSTGLLPVGLDYDGKRFYILFLKTPAVATDWRIVRSEENLEELKLAISDYTREKFIPMDFTSHNGFYHTLLVKLPNSGAKEWKIESFEPNNQALNQGIDPLARDKWIPWGMDLSANQLRVLFVR